MKLRVHILLFTLLSLGYSSCTISVQHAITHIDGCSYPANTQGAIDLDVTFGGGWAAPSCSPAYHWSNGEQSEDVDNLSAGTYTVGIDIACNYAGIGNVSQRAYDGQFDVLYQTSWITQGDAVALADGGVQNTASGLGLHAAYSENIISGTSGYDYLEFQIDDHLTGTEFGAASIGLHHSQAFLLPGQMDYALCFTRAIYMGNLIKIVTLNYTVGGVIRNEPICVYTNGDVFRMIRRPTGIEILQNGSHVFGVPLNYSGSLYACASFFSPGFEFKPVRMTAGCINNTTFNTLQRKLDGSYYTADKTIDFKYEGEYKPSSLNYKIYNMNRVVVMQPSDQGVLKSYGDNRLSIPLLGSHLTASNYYILEVINEKKESFFLRFFCKEVQ